MVHLKARRERPGRARGRGGGRAQTPLGSVGRPRQARSLACVHVLIDARHGLKDTATPSLAVLSEAAVSAQIVLIKTDQMKRSELEARIAATETALKDRPAAFPHALATSSRSSDGIAELRAAVAKLEAERAV